MWFIAYALAGIATGCYSVRYFGQIRLFGAVTVGIFWWVFLGIQVIFWLADNPDKWDPMLGRKK